MTDDPKCPACGVAWREHPGPTNMCEEIQRITEERDCARKSLHLAYRVLRLTIPRPHGCLCDACLEDVLISGHKQTYLLLLRLTAQCEGRAATIRRLLEEIERLINGEMFECIHCGELISGVDHWRTCPKHPAHAEIERLQAEREAYRQAGASLYVAAMDNYVSAESVIAEIDIEAARLMEE